MNYPWKVSVLAGGVEDVVADVRRVIVADVWEETSGD